MSQGRTPSSTEPSATHISAASLMRTPYDSGAGWSAPWVSWTPDLVSNAVQRSLADPPPTRRVVTAEGLAMLKDELYENGGPEERCPITHAPFEGGRLVTTMPCHHRFSPAAIRRWITDEKPECPVCRYELPHTQEPNRQTARRSDVDLGPLRARRPESATMIVRTRDLQRRIEDTTTELRSLGYEPYIVPNYTSTRARVSIRTRPTALESSTSPLEVPSLTQTRSGTNARHVEVFNEALALTLEAMIN